jgi:hypothetical protein
MMTLLSVFLTSVDATAVMGGLHHVALFLQANGDISGLVKSKVVGPLVTTLQICTPGAVGMYILYKVVSGHTEHAKMLIAEGVIVAGLLEGLLALVAALPG